MTTLLFLTPGTPMLFQGQEFAASTPFVYFSDHDPDLSRMVRRGRAEFLSQFRSIGSAQQAVVLPDPKDPHNFTRCKLNFSERYTHAETYALHKDLIRLRTTDSVFSRVSSLEIDGAVLGERTFLLRYFSSDGNDRLALINLDVDLHLKSIPEPLLAPPAGCRWQVLFSSEHPDYGGGGVYLPDRDGDWNIPGETATILFPVAVSPHVP